MNPINTMIFHVNDPNGAFFLLTLANKFSFYWLCYKPDSQVIDFWDYNPTLSPTCVVFGIKLFPWFILFLEIIQR